MSDTQVSIRKLVLINKPTVIYLGLFIIAMFQSLFRYLQVRLGPKTLFVDAKDVWRPLAARLAHGDVLYLGQAVDNKPPLFQFLNLGVFLTGRYTLVFTFLIGLANACSAVLLYRLFVRHDHKKAGAVSAVVLLSVLPLIGGLFINVRSLALPLVLLSLLSIAPHRRGVSLALAGLITQYAILLTPLVLIRQHFGADSLRDTILDFAKFTTAGVVTAAAAFGAVGLAYNTEAMVQAVYWSVGIGGDGTYITASQQHSPLYTPVLYAADFVRLSIRLPYIFIPAAVGIYTGIKNTSNNQWSFHTLLSLAAVLLGLQLLIRSFWLYWILSMPFLIGLAVLSTESFLNNHSDD